MRVVFDLMMVLAIGLVLGGLSAQLLIRQSHGIGAINVGPWSAWPFVGGKKADPYTAARATADGTLPLGAAEGLTFETTNDLNGTPLRLECQYRIFGSTTSASLWTLAAYSEQGKLVESSAGMKSATHSGVIVRFSDNTFEVTLGGGPSSGNWLPLSGQGEFKLILRLYDTPITSNSGVIEPIMPGVELRGCGL